MEAAAEAGGLSLADGLRQNSLCPLNLLGRRQVHSCTGHLGGFLWKRNLNWGWLPWVGFVFFGGWLGGKIFQKYRVVLSGHAK